jgi:hypothetical protein
MQDWDHAIEDFDYILYYQVIPFILLISPKKTTLMEKQCTTLLLLLLQPELDQVLAMRARAYSCRREWDKANADYENILHRHPDNAVAIAGLAEINVLYEDLPMLDKSAADS